VKGRFAVTSKAGRRNRGVRDEMFSQDEKNLSTSSSGHVTT
jgi:hypothetical protein